MKPVVKQPNSSLSQLVDELGTVQDSAAVETIIEQLLAKLQRKKRSLSDDGKEAIKTLAGMPVEDMVNHLRESSSGEAAQWLRERREIAQMLDRRDGGMQAVLISRHQDVLRSVERGYGDAERPQDYLDGFTAFLRENLNKIPALLVVTQRPRELTRAQLKEVRLLLDAAGFSETNLQVAWRETTNEDIAASIIGFIRQAALGDALVSYGDRVDKAMKKILASRSWTAPQRKWLERIGQQLKVEVIVDRNALDQGQFKVQGGGFDRLNKAFDGRLEEILVEINEALWQEAS
jgi:type I restriction enzyme R subunit